MWKSNKGNIWSNSIEEESIQNNKKPIKKEKFPSEKTKVVEKVVIEEKVVYKKAPDFSRSKSPRKSSALIIMAILIALTCIIVPFSILFSLMAKLINEESEVVANIGYRVGSTQFSIKHEESGKYITAPNTESENISVVDERPAMSLIDENPTMDDIFTIVYKTTDRETELWIQSKFFLGYNDDGQNNYLTMEVIDGSPVWSSDSQEKGISLEKKEDENLYGIKFESNEKYLSKDANSDQLTLSWSPDWFEFHAYVKPITKTSEYYYDYIFLNPDEESIELGVDGNPVSIQSTKTDLYLNSSGISFGPKNQDSINTSFLATEDEEFNFFVPDTKNEEITFASYATLNPMYYYDGEILNSDFYPTINASDDKDIYLDKIINSHDIPSLNFYDASLPEETLPDDSKPSSQVYLFYNPSNLREKAIYFVDDKSFLNTNEDGDIFLSKEREYFIFQHSAMKSPEDFDFSISDSNSEMVIFGLLVDHPEFVENFTIQMYGLEEDSSSQYGFSVGQNIRKVVQPKKSAQKVKIKDLDSKYTYYVYIALNRKEDAGLHKTIRLLTLTPPPDNGGDGWGEDDGWGDGGFGKDPAPASTKRLWDSSALNEAVDITDSDTNVQISLDFQQAVGIGVGRVKEVEVVISDERTKEEIARESSLAKTGILRFDFSGLEEETDYIVEVYFDGIKQDHLSNIEHNEVEGDNWIDITTEPNREDLIIEQSFAEVGGVFGDDFIYILNANNLYGEDLISLEFEINDIIIGKGFGDTLVSDFSNSEEEGNNLYSILYIAEDFDFNNGFNQITATFTLEMSGYEEEWVAAGLTTIINKITEDMNKIEGNRGR